MIFTARFIIADGTEISAGFDSFVEAKEWACIRQEHYGEDWSQIKIMRGLFAVVWAYPELRAERIREANELERWRRLPQMVAS